MTKPWEKYQSQDAAQVEQPTQSGKPWEQYQAPAQPKSNSWSDVPLRALKNIPSSAGEFASGIYTAVRHPINTVNTMLDLGAGALHNALPESVSAFIDKADAGRPEAQKRILESVKKADLAGEFFKDRYGSMEGLKNTIATDPVGFASDISSLASGGATLAGKLSGKAPMLSRAVAPLQTVSKFTNPINAVTKPAAFLAPKAGALAANLIGSIGTHTGGESIKQAFRSGKEGGESAASFADNMRGNVPMTDVLDAAKENLRVMGQQKSDAYRKGMAQVSGDKSILDFGNIDKAIVDAAGAVSFKGQVKNAKGAKILQEIAEAVKEWKALDPAEFHTPEGLDALKQRIGGIVESVPFEEKAAGMVGKQIYNSIKNEIVKQAPVYADTMKDYSQATEQIREIERSLSLGNKASIDTAMRKLQSLTRNNVNTNYGNRLDLAKQMEAAGGNQIMPALSGQALSSVAPRGLGGAVAGGLGLGGFMAGGAGLALPMLALQSPRLVGEAAHVLGKAYGAGQKGAQKVRGLLDVDQAELANYLQQMGRLQQGQN